MRRIVKAAKDDTYKKEWNEIEVLFKKAMNCQTCFRNKIVTPALVKIAQPRWIGPNYFRSKIRVIIIALNPGAGNSDEKQVLNNEFLKILNGFKRGVYSLQELFAFQKAYMPKWGKPHGKFLEFYTNKIGLQLNDIAFMNIAWCADGNNKWPPSMLSTCFQHHTDKLISLVQPHVAICSGSGTHKFAGTIEQENSQCKVIKTLHYAHREGDDRENTELNKVKQEIIKMGEKINPII